MWLVSDFSSLGFGVENGFRRSLLCVSTELSSRTVARKVFSPLQSLTSVFGMGTGGPSAFVALTIFFFPRTLWSLKIEQQLTPLCKLSLVDRKTT